MAETSKIEWTHATFNPWVGCTKVSPGCAHCYAEADFDKNKGFAKWGPQGTRRVKAESGWREPLQWDREAARSGERRRVFCASLGDVFEDWRGPMVDGAGRMLWATGSTALPWIPSYNGDKAPNPDVAALTMGHVRSRVFDLIDRTPNLDWLLLTKRPENLAGFVPLWWHDTPPSNVWLGTSVEDQAAADARITHLLAAPAAVRFLSCEPLLGRVRLTHVQGKREGEFDALTGRLTTYKGVRAHPRGIDWVIVGGESGPHARPMHPAWAQSLRDQCRAAGVPFFFKQWGEYIHTHPAELHLSPGPLVELGDPAGPVVLQRVGKKAAGRLLDGRTWDEIPLVG